MRTTEERINAMHARAAEMNIQRRARFVRTLQAVGSAASFAVVILLAVFMPRNASFGAGTAGSSADDMHASIFNGSGSLGYIVIAIVAFLLGMTVAIFCFRLKKWRDDKDDEEAQ